MVDEIDHVDGKCRYCGADFVAMSPDEVREHMVEGHDDVLAEVFVWPTDEEKELQELLRFMNGINDDGGPWEIILDDEQVGVTIAAHKTEDKLAVQQGSGKPDIVSRSAVLTPLLQLFGPEPPVGFGEPAEQERPITLIDRETGHQLFRANLVVCLGHHHFVVDDFVFNPHSDRFQTIIEEWNEEYEPR